MVSLGSISRSEADDANAVPLQLKPVGEQHWKHPYFVDLVLRQLGVLRARTSDPLDPRFDFLGRTFAERSARAYRGGLRIYTTLDPRVQDAAEAAVASQLPSDLNRLFAALAAIEPSTGYVRALVGGRDYYPDCRRYTAAQAPPTCKLAKVNLALGEEGGGSGRQPGSSFKPFVLTAALERGISLSSTYQSDPFTQSYRGGVWTVHNYEGEGGGPMNLVEGTAHSVNAVYARLLVQGVGDGDPLAGAQRVASIARRMGVSLPTPEELHARCGPLFARTDACLPADLTPAIALGAKEVSPYEMASAYATFANDGVRVQPTAIARVDDSDGHVLYRAKPERKRVIPAGVARAATSVLQAVVQRGTATAAGIDRAAAAKTGTSESWRDAWLDGYVPQLAAVVWVGNPIPRPGIGVESMTPANGYPYRVVGGTIPAMIWHAFMSKALDGIRVRDFAAPPSIFFEGVSAAAEPSPTSALAVGYVPDVTDMSVNRASAELSAVGLGVTSVGRCDPTGTGAQGDVYKQSPPAGSAARAGSSVTIWWQPNGC
jgi:penicillin-binding protein 1A